MATGLSEMGPGADELKNLDSHTDVPWGEDTRDVVFCLSKSTNERAVSIFRLANAWKTDPARHDLDELTQHIDRIVSARLCHIREWIQVNTSRLHPDSTEIRSLKSAFETTHHSQYHNCQTSHRCLARCEHFEKHDQEEETLCGLPAGHLGRHLCDPTTHACGERCALSSHEACQIYCMKETGHPVNEGHLCSAKDHYSGKVVKLGLQ
ncbi:hypothetical protein FRC03_011218 [Tulasnella sp. 419]|nr:hypothetical protein FRC03_011218 [Tulasnella sp. 419]